jgi:flagellar hook protein FlgE
MLNSIIRSGLAASEQQISVVSNNIANVGTNGFKRSTSLFEDIYMTGMQDSTSNGMGIGAKAVAPRRVHATGSIETSTQTLDMAVLGNGMFVLEPREGEATPCYTRNGAAQLDSEGRITNSNGQAFLDVDGQPITVPAAFEFDDGRRSLLTALSIEPSGAVRAVYGNSGEQLLGVIGLARFRNEAGLRAIGDAMFADDQKAGAATIAAGSTPGYGTIQSGALEKSNTDLTSELIRLMSAQQSYSGVAKALQASVDMDKRLIDG